MRDRITYQTRSGGLTVIGDEVSAPQATEIQDLANLPAAEIKIRVEAAGGIYSNKSQGIEFLRGQKNAG